MELRLGRRVGGPVALLLTAAVVVAGGAYFAGVIQTLGYEQRHVTFSGFASGTKSGGGFGLKHMLFFEGQTFFADYDADVREGSLRIGILETFGPTRLFFGSDFCVSEMRSRCVSLADGFLWLDEIQADFRKTISSRDDRAVPQATQQGRQVRLSLPGFSSVPTAKKGQSPNAPATTSKPCRVAGVKPNCRRSNLDFDHIFL